ncbi:MAG: glycosyltransferase family 39 protein [Actinomycetota bacterium]|nr:glycosyltransferase family 39 protein [Actinomycetota bacterium]
MSSGRSPLARVPVFSAMAALAVLLTATSNGYGFHRDELYFRVLPPAWGYIDQPPFVPLLGRITARLSADPWAMRVPATILAVAAVLVVVLITCELGGGRTAQALCAWGYAFAAFPLVFGHVLLTGTVDLLIWPLVCLLVIKAILRDPRWWLGVGGVIGLATYNKLLISLLVLALVLGLLIVGPRQVFRSRWVWIGVGIAVVVAAPNLIYQATHGWPQVIMGQALTDRNAGNVRVQMWQYLLLLLGPPPSIVCGFGLVALWRRPDWRLLRFLIPALLILLIETFVGGGQIYYPLGLVTVLFAVGCVPAGTWLDRSWRRWTAVALFAVNTMVSALIALPLLPLSVLANTPIPGMNQVTADSIGWPDYAREIGNIYRAAAAKDPTTVVIVSNYGEYGAVVQYGPANRLPHPGPRQSRQGDSCGTVLAGQQ